MEILRTSAQKKFPACVDLRTKHSNTPQTSAGKCPQFSMRNITFFTDISGTFINMSEIAMLSRKFQEPELNYSDLKSTLITTCNSIEQKYLVDDGSLGPNLRDFMDKYSGANLYHEFEMKRSHKDTALPEVLTEFASFL